MVKQSTAEQVLLEQATFSEHLFFKDSIFFKSATFVERAIFSSGDAILEAIAQRCSVKKVFLEISQNSQENACARVFF